MQLYTYYRSQASFRVRIALNLKGIAREDSFLHLEKGDQFAAAYQAINPQMVVPTLIDGNIKLFQSLAILEYLEEKFPEPPLLPADAQARAWVRGIALINAADSHPLIVPRVRHYLTDVLKVSDDQRLAWIQHWLGAGLQAMETLLAERGQSSGGHLAAVSLTTDWPRDFGLPADILKGGMCISGMYDLTPVRLSARSNYVEFDDATVAALSPIRHLDRLRAPLIVAYGTCETPEYSASGVFCHGDRPTIADICLVTQVTPAKTFDLPLDPYPRVIRIYDNCMAIPAFADAHPAKQPDAE